MAFTTWHHDPADPASLSTNDITQLADAPGGRLWVATGDAGLDRLDPATGRFEHWRHDPHVPGSLASDVVYALAPAPDGSLWIGTGNGLDRLAPDGRQVQHVAYLQAFGGGANPKDKVVGALLAEPDGSLWIGTWSGVLLKRLPDGRLLRVPVQSGKDAPDQIWRIEGGGDDVRVGTRFGLLRVGVDGVARPLLTPAQMAPSYVFASARDEAGRLWMATLHGVVMLDPQGSVHTFHSQPLLLGGLPGEWTWRVIRDREGGLWFTFYDGGVAYLAPGWNAFSRYTHVPDDAGSLRGTVAELVAPSADGKLWVGSRGRLDKLDPATGRAQHVLDGLHTGIVSLVDDGHGLWFTERGLLMHYTGGKPVPVDPDHRIFSRPELLARGAGDALYVTVARDGVLRIDTASMAMSPVPMPPDATGVDLRPGIITWQDGALWYSDHEGLMRSDAHGRLQFVPGVPRGEDVSSLAFGPHGFWLERGSVLERYRWDGQRAVRDRVVGVRQGWKAPVVNGMEVDAAGRLWIFSPAGLWRLDAAADRLVRLGAQDGLASSEFNGSPVTRGDGKAWYVPSEGGVIGFVPGRVRRTGVPPPLAVVDLSVRNGHGVRRLDAAHGGVIRLAWNDRDLRVGVRALSYIDPRANRYRFRLVGLDPDWVDGGNRGDREFTGLPAGDYTLEVAAAGAEGVWSHLSAPLRIHVQAPPWMRWWAWLLYVALAALLAWAVLSAWRRRLAHRHQILLAEQRRSLAEQASAAKSQFLATLSHEIRTPMTGVMGMAELLLATPQSTLQREYTETMQRSGGLLLKLVNDALDLARIEVGKLELEPVPFDPRALAEDVASLERAQARAKGLAMELQLAEDLPARLVGDVVRIKQVLLNLVGNALKFTEHGSVTLSMHWQGDALLCTVSDTGPGIPEENQARLFERFEQDDGPQRRSGSGLGLAICRELVALMHGAITLHSRPGRGSAFSVRLPLPVAPAAKRRMKVSAAAVAGRALDVLLVEDDAIVAAVIRGLLEGQGHRVRYAGNGLQALAELAQGSCDAVLLDLDLPGVDGLQVARLIRQGEVDGRRVWIIAITARSGGDEEARSRAAGMDGFLRKPLTGAQLAEVLAAVPYVRAAVV
jgi:signal transduction histidine kinase/ligand-binding sensor domain-containing protein/CheY-like chemotaxis protein